ncbi:MULTISPECIES: branched-chain amino acid ABC transporter permease [unclassified Chelatococcus]|uniref:branched-chain amino acid ABC transporter permease n=1 Tax=unclassified Chelatococcus TaxID=2638111 RepID=UPI001BCAB949|nr:MULTISPECIES: branched-chain amino acid ABC transporter permease [unclassified Chelatococcus]CAH1651873.1 Amino acid/amide ABC transporter membrane protein 2 (HAAT family) [Hyphomicrobiales bacterium]MBS7743108.1 branched-chain amino acid ABC transporter permease [Chelatococcus sp. HY11]MBX3541774.1 branched-chain amino acid ABC transporter permease [Chelatococcus sp.]MCO5074334.1 branched-chain amino acid ABC transporter permease [Chelatococcus sp.]CAH1693529.1 Amino acid/amide ABC transpo
MTDAVLKARSVAGPARARRSAAVDAVAVLFIVAAAAFLYFFFPGSLALFTRMIAIMLLALSLDLVTGFAGIATLGHAALFGAGAYAAGILASKFGLTDPFAMLGIGAVAGALAGTVSSLVILRGRGLGQLVLSIAIVQLAHEAANKLSAWTGGSDGLSGIVPAPVFGLFRFDLWGRTAFILAVAILLVAFVVLRVIVRSPFGMLCRGIKQDPIRVSAMGAPVYGTLVKLYAIAGAVAGLGGALSAIATKVVGLDSLSFTLSAEALVMLVLGGVGKLFGALLGTFVFIWFEHLVSAINPFHWLTIVGAMLIAVVLFEPKGLTGALEALWKRARGGEG